jgi:hypothetical protein
MIQAHSDQEEYGTLLEAVRGLVFFGVPHRGASAASFFSSLANLLGYTPFTFRTNPAYLNDLKKRPDRLTEIADLFKQRAKPLRILSFYEMQRMGINVV